MQAINTDIDVSSKIAFDLQNTQNLTNTQNSKSSISFSSLLESVRNEAAGKDVSKTDTQTKTDNKIEKSEDKTVKENTADSKKDVKSEEKVEKKSEETAEKKSEPTEKVDEKEKTEDSKQVKSQAEKKSVKPENQKTVENGIKGKNQQENSEIKNDVASKVLKESDSKVPQSEKKEGSKKLQKDFDRMEELVGKKSEETIDAELLVSAVPVENIAKTEKTAKIDASEDIKIDAEKLALDSDEDLSLENFNTSEKVSVLDKDGKIIVKDYRTEDSENQDLSKDKKNFTNEVQFNNDNTATITMDLNPQNVEANVLSLNSQTAASNGSDFQAMLNNQIQTSIPDFVKAGSIILKDNDKGSINLVLHPDDIGNVKINLSMDGKTVSGHIIVQTKEAMAMFRENAQDLRNEFIKNGFDVSNFDVSYNDNSGSNQDRGFENFNGAREFAGRKLYNDMEGVATSRNNEYEEINSMNSEYSINIVA